MNVNTFQAALKMIGFKDLYEEDFLQFKYTPKRLVYKFINKDEYDASLVATIHPKSNTCKVSYFIFHDPRSGKTVRGPDSRSNFKSSLGHIRNMIKENKSE